MRVVAALKKLVKQLGRQSCCDRALGLFGTHEEPRSIVQSRTIERRVLVTNCGRRRSLRDDRGGQAGPVVDAHARDARTGAGAPPSTRCHTARSVPLVGGHRRITTPLLPHTPSTHPSPLRHTPLGGDSERARSHARSCRHARSSVASLATSVVRPSSLSADLRRSSRTCGRSARARCSCRCEGFAAVRAATQRQLSRCVRVTAGLLGGRRLGGPAVGRSASESGLGQPGVVRHD